MPGSYVRCLLVKFLFVSSLVIASANVTVAQRPPVCDITCTGDPTSSDYLSIFEARPLVPNQRGGGAPINANGGPAIAQVQLGSNSFNYNVPLISLSGRGGLNLNLVLYYNSRIWTVSSGSNNIAFNADRDFPSYGFRLDFGFIEMASDGSLYVLTEADGTKHSLESNGGAPGPWVSTDSTYYIWDYTNNILTTRGGLRTFYQQAPVTSTILRPYQIEDANGNIISIAYVPNKDLAISTVTDSLGRQVIFNYDTNGRLASIVQGSQAFNFSWTTVTLSYAFTKRVVNSPANGAAINVLSGINLPDHTSVTFDYGNGDWGVVKAIRRIGSSGQIRYSTSYNFPAVANGALTDAPGFSIQTVFDGVNTANWSYASTRDATSGVITSTTVTDPSGTSIYTAFSDAGNSLDGLPLTKRVTDANGNLLRLVTNAWTSSIPIPNPQVTTVTTQLETGEQSQQQYTYDANGNVTDLKEFDFGNGAPGPLLRETVKAFASLGNHIIDRPSSMIVKDGSGSSIARTDFAYDQVPVQDVNPPGTAVIQHDPAYSVNSANSRGNLTGITTYTNAAAGTGASTETNTYDISGNLVKQQTSCCQKLWSFSAATQYAYPDTVARGPVGNQLTTSATYNFASGLVASTTDENGQTTRYSYDASNRMIGTAQPDGTIVTKTYDDSSQLAAVTIATTSNSLVQRAVLDGLGRILTEQTFNGSTLVSTKTTAYDNAGRTSSVSNIYGPNDTPAYTTYQYDALGRLTQIMPPGNTVGYSSTYSGHIVTATDPANKQRKNYADGLGRLVRVDEPGQSGGSAGAGSVTVSGTEQTASTPNGGGATPGTGSVSIGGSENSTQVLTHAATTATGSVTINGVEQCFTPPPPPPPTCRPPMPCCIGVFHDPWQDGKLNFLATAAAMQQICDAGTITIWVNGHSDSYTFGSGDTTSTIASHLAQNINADGSAFVNASASGATVSLTSRATGAAANYTLSSTYTFDSGDFSGPSFTTANSGGALTGGTNATYQTVYNTGTVKITLTQGGTNYSKSYTYGQNDTASTVASNLVSQMHNDSTFPVDASVSGALINLTTRATGIGTGYPLSTSAVTTSSNFSSSAFSATPSGANLTSGQNGVVSDAGTLTVSITGFTAQPYSKTVNYSVGSTAATVANGIMVAFNNDSMAPVSASISSGTPNVVALTAKTLGADTNYTVTATSATTQGTYFSHASFSGSAASLTGGADPVASLNTPLSTSYTYDPMGNLLQSVQGQQTRTYTYNSLGQMLTSRIPETNYNTTAVAYTPSGQIAQKTDPRGVVTTFTYDSLNRVSRISHSDGTPAVTYTYGSAGVSNFGAARLVQTTDGIGTQTYQYNNMGQITQMAKTIGSNTYTVNYNYNPAGQLASITYPSGRAVTDNYDAIGRLTQVGTGGVSVANIGAYNAAGQILSVTYGNGMYGTFSYNSQMQITNIQYSSSGTALLNLGYSYGANDNGQVQSVTDNLNAARTTSYAYDELGRLKMAQTIDLSSPNTWKLKFIYDRYGNRLGQIPVAGNGTAPLSEISIDPTTNRIASAGYTYDANGNMVNDGLHTYTFDAANRITSVDGAANTYAYDLGGTRVKKNGTLYFYSGNKLIAEYASGASPASPTVEYVYVKDQMAAKIASGAITYFYGDHLSTRTEANSSGSVVRTYGHFPFGETWYETGTADKWKFTTYESDSESSLDYAQARYDAPALGRFMSLDTGAPSPGNPQSLNRYPYVMNDPINRTDPSGLYPMDQHEFMTFLLATVAQQQDPGFEWDPTQLAMGARDADALYAATALPFGFITNFNLHFGIPGPLGSDSYKAGFMLHTWEDNGDDAPHRISGNADSLGARILNEALHAILNLAGHSPDTSGNIEGFRDAWQGDDHHGDGMGQDPSKFPEQMIDFIVGFVDANNLTIVGMTITTMQDTIYENTTSLCEGPDGCDLSDATLVATTKADGFTVNIWQQPGEVDPLAGIDWTGVFFSELAMGTYSGGFAAGNPFGPNQQMLDCLAAGMPSGFCQDVFGSKRHPPMPN